jgi:hypothetical protein
VGCAWEYHDERWTANLPRSRRGYTCRARDQEKTRGLYLDRFGIVAAGVEARTSHTGVITVRGLSATGAVSFGRQADTFRIEAACDINYESLDRAQGREVDKGSYYLPATEPATAVIEGRVMAVGKRAGRLQLDPARIHVSCRAGGFEEVVAIEILLKKATLTPIAAPGVHYRFGETGEWSPSEDSNIDSNVCIASTRRQLIVQPVGFREFGHRWQSVRKYRGGPACHGTGGLGKGLH